MILADNKLVPHEDDLRAVMSGMADAFKDGK